MEFNSTVSVPLQAVRDAFTDPDSKLMNRLLPFGCGVMKFKGIRRRAKISIYTWFFQTYHFKVAMCNSTESLYYFHIINENNLPFGIKLWTNRYSIVKSNNGCNITNTIEYTTKNVALDKVLSVFITILFKIRALKYKLFFIFNK